MTDDVIEALIGTGTGLLLWGLSAWWPLRPASRAQNLRVDLVAAGVTMAFTGVLVKGAEWAMADVGTLLEPWYEWVEPVPVAWFIPVYIVVADFGAYWGHRLLHTRWLWHAHAWHHAPRHLYWIAGLRGSPVHLVLLGAPYLLAFIVFPLPEATATVVALAVLDAGNQHLIHSNLAIPGARRLEWLFVTPRFHHVHHNAEAAIANSNYGFIFSVWDRLFGTYIDPDRVPEDAPLGLGYEIPEWRLALGLPPARRGSGVTALGAPATGGSQAPP
jgi:sterol desaturase/sphingolipid hydroxylase (fatty acid hydroxylase superfamily)